VAAKSYDFAANVAAFSEKVQRNIRAWILEGFQDMAGEVYANWTGFKKETGFSRASWHIRVNDAPGGIGSYQLGDTISYANSAVYARRLELGFVGTDSLGRHYNQAGRFIVQDVFNRAPAIFAAAAARIDGA
jgi:hypothetical protein